MTIALRQGKAKSILESSRSCVLTAVETYNRPNNLYRSENYIVLMVIGWTKLFHAYFQAKIGSKYFYKDKNGRYMKIDGEKRAWDLRECVKQFNKKDPELKLSEAVIKNLYFFIEIRNKIEHSFWCGADLDLYVFGECQALLFNYEKLLVNLFGDSYAIEGCLAFALQFSHSRSENQSISQKMLLSKEMRDLKNYIDKYKIELNQEVYDSQEYSIKFLLIPKVSNTNRKDMAVEFVNWNTIDAVDRENYQKITAIIKDKIVYKSASNINLLKPSNVIDEVNQKTGASLNMANHTCLWKAFGIRPERNSQDKFDTMEKYCLYDEPHDDYLYTNEWVNFIVNLIEKYKFNKDNIKERCETKLDLKEYEYNGGC
ncbi:DUF3644 domain-containing protein [Acidaminococcus fermentans]|uniref:DUF3644 domain-containing protein n=1 Tax=Acidaminococcus fermentans TaxID=905 RepID=UPI003F898529